MPPLLSLFVSSSSLVATALTDAMSESVPLFFCSDFRKKVFVDLNWKRFWRGRKKVFVDLNWKRFWRGQDLNPRPSDLIHDDMTNKTIFSFVVLKPKLNSAFSYFFQLFLMKTLTSEEVEQMHLLLKQYHPYVVERHGNSTFFINPIVSWLVNNNLELTCK